MINNQYFPFEKNRYYYGKLLTANDLETEQRYVDLKRYFINKMMFGSGRVCGLKVYNVNEDTLMIESGFAIDSMGREIVVDQSSMRKISSIDGFDEIKSEKMVLAIKYDETLTQPVYSIAKNSDGKEYEYNKVIENYKLELKEYVRVNDDLALEEKLIYCREIYSDGNYRVLVKMPTVASASSDFKIALVIEKLTDISDCLNLRFIMNIPGFNSKENGEKLMVDLNNVNVGKDECFVEEFWIAPTNILVKDNVNFMIKKEDVKINIGSSRAQINDNILFLIHISDNCPLDIIKTKVKSESLEDVMNANTRDYVELAVIDVMYIGSNCVVQSVTAAVESKYTPQMPSQAPNINKIMEYYENNNKLAGNSQVVEIAKKSDNKNFDLDFRRKINTVISSGVFDMPLGLNVKPNKTILSDEIMHNLGAGDVCVNVGFEFVALVPGKKDSYMKKIIFGNPEIFKDDSVVVPNVSSAVQVFCEKGTFVVGLRFAQVTNLVNVKVRWFAYRQPDVALEEVGMSDKERGIFVKQDTIKLQPNEVHFIEIGFRNMNPTAVRYEVVDKDGGEIDENGVYTAPNRDGVYEVKISCINEPSIYTFAYVVVIKKDEE